uniref:Uncharacterized protein n=1 Tax=Panagrolaimus davidi TaxID=227884 RepID=A0A914Q3W3_9BILA
MTCPNVKIFGDNLVRKSNTTEVEDDEISALKKLASSAREIGLKIRNTQPKPQSIFNEDPLLSYLASKYPYNNNNGDQYNGVIVGEIDPETQRMKWTSSRDIFSQPSNVRHPLTNSVARDPGFRSGLLKFDPYIPKRNPYFNMKNPNNFNDENIVVKN